ncbi:MAG: cytochrome C oxidase subunit IV family protein [Bacteroidales bacterium]
MENKHHQALNFKTYLFIWVALLELTALSVAAATVDFKALAVGVALFIAVIKSYIVGAYFMHLKFDSKILTAMVLITLFVFLTFIVLTFFDYIFRPTIA